MSDILSCDFFVRPPKVPSSQLIEHDGVASAACPHQWRSNELCKLCQAQALKGPLLSCDHFLS
jgi:hypothetical protein